LLVPVVTYLVLAATMFAPVDQHGASVEHLRIKSEAVGETLGVSVVEPGGPEPAGKRPLLVFLHGRGGSDGTFTGNEAVFTGLQRLGRRARSSPSPTAATTATGTTAATAGGRPT
jgi:hypothetical protein